MVERLYLQGCLVRWLTQNIDGLEFLTSVPRELVSQLHGNIPPQIESDSSFSLMPPVPLTMMSFGEQSKAVCVFMVKHFMCATTSWT
jgi:hypothetical protein